MDKPKKKMKWWKKALLVVAILLMLVLLGLFALAGIVGYAGPLKGIGTAKIGWAYKNRPTGEIVFYGASNFTLWLNLEKDMSPLAVQNHGFGGSADSDLMEKADELLYPYQPSTVVFQSGSNDFVSGLTVDETCANKDKMYAEFRSRLPDATFVVMSMLPLPGRTEYWTESQAVNAHLKALCVAEGNMVFLDATEALTAADGTFRPELFRSDGIHLNRDGQLIWGAIIKAALLEIAK